jgi:hypothetical protein
VTFDMTPTLKHLKYHAGTYTALVLAALAIGCALLEPKAPSPVDGRPVTLTELSGEVEAFLAKAEPSAATIDRHREVRQLGLSFATKLASAAGIGIPEAALGLGGLLAVGVGYDYRKKNRVILKKDETIAALANGHAPPQ